MSHSQVANRRRWVFALLAALGMSALAASANGQSNLKCARGIFDQSSPGDCIGASSAPVAGTVLPLGPYFFVDPTGNVGLGTMTPSARLEVSGDLRANGSAAFGSDGSLGTASNWTRHFDFSQSIADFSPSLYWAPFHSTIRLDPSVDLSGPNAKYIFGHYVETEVASGNPHDFEYIQGPYMAAFHRGTGTVDLLTGGFLLTQTWGITNYQLGGEAAAFGTGAGIVENNYGFSIRTGHFGSGGYIGNNHGLYISSPSDDMPLTNNYGIYLEDQDYGQQQSYALYSAGGQVYVADNVGIGTPTPSAKLHVDGNTFLTGNVGIGSDPGLSNTKLHIERGATGRILRAKRTDTQQTLDLWFHQPTGVTAIQASIYGAGDELAINPDGGNVGIGTTAPANILTVQMGSATDPVADAWTIYSSRRFKENIRTIPDALEKVARLRGVYFDWRGQGRGNVGLIAEEVGEVLPQLVQYEQNGTDARSVDYARLTAVLIEAVKAQQGILRSQTVELSALRADLDALASSLDELRSRR